MIRAVSLALVLLVAPSAVNAGDLTFRFDPVTVAAKGERLVVRIANRRGDPISDVRLVMGDTTASIPTLTPEMGVQVFAVNPKARTTVTATVSLDAPADPAGLSIVVELRRHGERVLLQGVW